MEENSRTGPGFVGEVLKQLTNIGSVALVACFLVVSQVERFAGESERYSNAWQFQFEKLLILLVLIARIFMVAFTEWGPRQGSQNGTQGTDMMKAEFFGSIVVGGAAFLTLIMTKYDEHGIDVAQSGRLRLILTCAALIATSAPTMLRTYLRSARNRAIEKLVENDVECRDIDALGQVTCVNLTCPGTLTEAGEVVKMMTISEGMVNLFDVCHGKLECCGHQLPLQEHKAASKYLNGKDAGSYTAMTLDEALHRASDYIDDSDGNVQPITKSVRDRLQYQCDLWSSEFVLGGITSEQSGKVVFVAATVTEHRLRDDAFCTVEDLKGCGMTVSLVSDGSSKSITEYARKLRIKTDDIVLGSEWRRIDAAAKKAAAAKSRVFAEFTADDQKDLVTAQKSNGEIVAIVTDNAADAKCASVADVTACMKKSGKELEASATVILPGKLSPFADAVVFSRGVSGTAVTCANYVITMGLINALLAVTDAMIYSLPLLLTSRRLLWMNLITLPFAYVISLSVKPAMKQKFSIAGSLVENCVKVFVGFTCATLSRLVVYALKLARYAQPMDSVVKAIFSGQFRTVVLQEPVAMTLMTVFGIHVVAAVNSYSRGEVDIRSREMRPLAICVGCSGLLFLMSLYFPFFTPVEIGGLSIFYWVLALGLVIPFHFVDNALKRARCQ